MALPWAPKSKMSYKSPPPTLVVSYAGRDVAELKRVNGKYAFQYLADFRELNLSPLPGLPTVAGETMHEELPLFFKERLPDLRRPEINRWLYLHPEIDRNDDLQLLGALGAHSITDSFVLSRRSFQAA
jgi:HipA-like protein